MDGPEELMAEGEAVVEAEQNSAPGRHNKNCRSSAFSGFC